MRFLKKLFDIINMGFYRLHRKILKFKMNSIFFNFSTSLSKRLLLWSWDLTKRGAKALILSPWTFLLFLIRLIFFFILKLPYFISIKLPYLLMRLVVWWVNGFTSRLPNLTWQFSGFKRKKLSVSCFSKQTYRHHHTLSSWYDGTEHFFL